MTLTTGTGPFGDTPAGSFNGTWSGPGSVLYLERSPRRIRAVVAGETVVDSRDARLLHESGRLPVYYFPEGDVRTDLLEATDHHTRCPVKGRADYRSVRVGDEVRENAVWTYPDPPDGAVPLAGLLALAWDAVDAWWEEAERIHVHPRDPYHRIDVVDTDRHVAVEVGGRTVADSARATMLFETGLPPRLYLPETDVDTDLLVASDTVTSCPYKGTTTRWYHAEAGGERVEDAAWVYDQPLPEATGIRGRIAFFNERVDLVVDGRRWARPDTPFS